MSASALELKQLVESKKGHKWSVTATAPEELDEKQRIELSATLGDKYSLQGSGKTVIVCPAPAYLCYDVETSSLHRSPWMVGAVALDGDGNELASFRAGCPLEAAILESSFNEQARAALQTAMDKNWLVSTCFAPRPDAKDPDNNCDWIKNNIPKSLLENPTHKTPSDIREAFWEFYLQCRGLNKNLTVLADWRMPVELNFISQCVLNKGPEEAARRKDLAPKIVHEVATLQLALGIDPFASFERLDTEKPEHDPVCDARYSGRLFVEYLRACRKIGKS